MAAAIQIMVRQVERMPVATPAMIVVAGGRFPYLDNVDDIKAGTPIDLGIEFAD